MDNLTDEIRKKGNKARWEGHNKTYIICLNCGKEKRVFPKDVERGKGKFCSQLCANIYNGKNKSNEKTFKQNGYIYLKLYDHPNRSKQNLVAEHRVIIERKIGRYLTNKEVVHHIDKNKSNNEIYNLYLCKDDLEHRQIENNNPDFMIMLNQARYSQWKDFSKFDVTKNRQDQLQEIFLGKTNYLGFPPDSDLSIILINHMYSFQRTILTQYRLPLNTLEKWWLAALMSQIYSKQWNPEIKKWEKIN